MTTHQIMNQMLGCFVFVKKYIYLFYFPKAVLCINPVKTWTDDRMSLSSIKALGVAEENEEKCGLR